MADEAEDKDSKTEHPTQRRLEDAYKKGQIPFSKEVAHFFILTVFAFIVSSMAPGMLRQAQLLLTPFLSNAADMPMDRPALGQLLSRTVWSSFSVIGLPLIALVVAAIASGVLQNGVRFSGESIRPKLDKLSPLKGLGRIFSKKGLIEFLKGLVKMTIVGIVCFMSIYPELMHLRQVPNDSPATILAYFGQVMGHMLLAVAITMFFIALFDLLYQRFAFIKSLRMSKQELKDEYKQQEGDPVIKQRLRKIRMERAQQRMMAAVPKADVIITNPTHFAVALQYNQSDMSAPKLVAKGQDFTALKIREIATEHKIPIVENPPLARALFATVDIDQEIPIDHYEAVAKIISYVYQLQGRTPSGRK